MKKITYIVSGIDHSKHFEWIAQLLDRDKFLIQWIFVHDREPAIAEQLREMSCEVTFIPYVKRGSMLSVFWEIVKILRRQRPDIIHTHLWEASWLGLMAGFFLRIKKRVYTRHHGAIHHMYFPRALWYDKLLNSLATDIVVLSSAHSKLVHQEGVSENKLRLIPHGFDIEHFQKVDKSRITAIKKRYKIPDDALIVGSIARYTQWKGIQDIIPAMFDLMKEMNLFWVLANAKGDFQEEIKEMLSTLPKGSVVEIEFEEDIAALYKTFDLFIHVPIHPVAESFGQVYLEAMISEIPSIFTISGILSDIDIGNANVVCIPHQDQNAIRDAIEQFATEGRKVSEGFNADFYRVERMIKDLTQLYVG